MKTHELLIDESVFCRGNYAVTTEDRNTFTSPVPNPQTGKCNAVRRDIVGALMFCYPNTEEYYQKFDAVTDSPRLHEWVHAYKSGVKHEELAAINKKYGVDWVVFNDFAPFNIIQKLLRDLNV